MLGIPVEQFPDSVGVQLPAHLLRGALRCILRLLPVGRAGRTVRNPGKDLHACIRACLDDKFMPVHIDNFRYGQVKSRVRTRACPHRYTKTRVAGLGTLYGNNKDLLAAPCIVRIGVVTGGQYPVLDGYGLQLAWAHSNECHLRCCSIPNLNVESVIGLLRLP
jgi:hypothetical protein